MDVPLEGKLQDNSVDSTLEQRRILHEKSSEALLYNVYRLQNLFVMRRSSVGTTFHNWRWSHFLVL